jgi:hypothetical protein
VNEKANEAASTSGQCLRHSARANIAVSDRISLNPVSPCTRL